MSESYTIEECRSCSAPIIWAITTKATKMPVDAHPSPDGNIAVEQRPGMMPLARVLNTTQRFGRSNLHTSHFASCQQADSWRKRGRPLNDEAGRES